MPTVLLGNHAALEFGELKPGERVTTIRIPDVDTHNETMRTITHDDGIWIQIAAEPAVWVASDDNRLATSLAAHFGCPVIDWDEANAHLLRAAYEADRERLEKHPPETPLDDDHPAHAQTDAFRAGFNSVVEGE